MNLYLGISFFDNINDSRFIDADFKGVVVEVVEVGVVVVVDVVVVVVVVEVVDIVVVVVVVVVEVVEVVVVVVVVFVGRGLFVGLPFGLFRLVTVVGLVDVVVLIVVVVVALVVVVFVVCEVVVWTSVDVFFGFLFSLAVSFNSVLPNSYIPNRTKNNLLFLSLSSLFSKRFFFVWRKFLLASQKFTYNSAISLLFFRNLKLLLHSRA